MRFINKLLTLPISIHNKILVLSILSILLPIIIVGGISSSITAGILEDRISESNLEMTIQVSDNLDFLLMEIEKSAEILLENEEIQDYFNKETSGELNSIFVYETIKTIEKQFGKLIINKPEISYINLSTPLNEFVLEYPETGISIQKSINLFHAQQGNILKRLEQNGQTSFWNDDINLWPNHSEKNRINFFKIIKNEENSETIGILMIGVNKDNLIEKLRSNVYPLNQNYFAILSKRSPVFILNPDNELGEKGEELDLRLLEGSDRNTISTKQTINNTKYLVSRYRSDYSGWDAVSLVPLQKILASVHSLQILTINISIVCILLSIVFIFLLTRRITYPIKKLTYLVNRIEEGHWGASYPTGKKQEDPFLKTTAEKLFGLKGSFRSILIKYFLIITMIPLAVLIITLYGMSMKIVEKEVVSSMIQSMDYINKRLELSLESAEQSSKFLFSNQIIQEGLLDYDKLSLEEKVNTEKVFEKLFLQEQSSKSNMAYINIFSLEGQPLFFSLNVYYNKKDVTDEVWYKRICSTEGETVITNTYKDNLGNDVISIIRKINNVLQYTTTVGRPVGYLMISYYETLLESTYKNVNFGDGGNFYIIDKNNIIISNKDKSLLGKKLDAEIWSKLPNGQEPVIRTFYGDRYLVFNHAAQNTDWRLVGILPLREVFSWNKNIFIHNLYILILSFFISLFMAFTFSSRISIPIAALRDKMKQVEAGAFPESISVKSGDEIEELAKSFNSMVKKLKELIEEVYQAEITRQKAEIRQKEAELNTLQAQINPHFLYNTLETINWIAIELLGHDNDISNTVLALSSLLRSTITRGDKIVPVEKQLKEIEEYLFIQKMRYEDKFTVRWNIDQGILQYKMLSMVIQPIVENAIVHGIENIESGGEIVIKGWEHDGDLFFEISDNGVGMDKEKLEEIRKMIDYEESMPSGSIGLRNTHQRLRHYYGENYGLKIDRDTGGWTKVTICAPAVIEHS